LSFIPPTFRTATARDWFSIDAPAASFPSSSLKSVLRKARATTPGLLDVKLERPKRDEHNIEEQRDFPNKAEINLIIDNAEGRWRPLLITAIFTGMRASELRGLRWSDIDWNTRVIHVRQRADRYNQLGKPKSKAGQRQIPMSPMVVNVLREWKLQCPKGAHDLVFPNGAGNPEHLSNILKRGFYKLQRDIGIVDADGKPKFAMHALRHFCASYWIEQRFIPKRIQYMLGHKSFK
jgi:integrase